MKKFLISTMVVLMSLAAQAEQINTSNALEALFKAAPTTMADSHDSKISLETILSPHKDDLAVFIATDRSLGSDGGGSKSLRKAEMECAPLSAAYAKCTLSMERTSGIGTTIDFLVVIGGDGSMQLTGPVSAESDL